MAILQINN